MFCHHLINGELLKAESGKTFDLENPATGEVFGQAAWAGNQDIDKAVEAAEKAQREWAKVSAKKRGQMLFEIARKLRENEEALVEIMVKETGKAVRTECRPEVKLLPEVFEFFGGLGSEIKGETVPFDPGMLTFTLRQPVGVVGVILPWNVPLMLMGFKVAAALVCGNTVVIKSAEQSPMTTLKAVEILDSVLPKGVVNILSGDGPETGAGIVKHPGVKKVTFTGSVEAGRAVYKMAAERIIPVTLELGGKNPMIIAEDADLDEVVEGAVVGMRFTRQGQSCSAASRIFVHESVHDAFLEKLKAQVNLMRIGDPADEATDIGSVISKEQLERIQYYVGKGKEVGEVHLCCDLPKEERLKGGYYYQPVIFSGIKNSDEIAQNEVFGPVTVLIKWKDFDDVLKQANDTRYGLTATIWTRDVNKALRGVEALDAGMVQVNQNLVVQPGLSYGGFKESGIGKEASLEGMLEHFTKKKTVLMKIGSK